MIITNETDLQSYLSTLPDILKKHKAFHHAEYELLKMLDSGQKINVSEKDGVISFITNGITYKESQEPHSIMEGLRIYTTEEGDLRYTKIYGANYDTKKYFADKPAARVPTTRTYLSVEYKHYIYDKNGVLNSEARFSDSLGLDGFDYDYIDQLKDQVFTSLHEPTWTRSGKPINPIFYNGAVIYTIQRYKTALATIEEIEYDEGGQIAKIEEKKGIILGEYPHLLRVDVDYAKRDKDGYYKPYPPKPEDKNKGEREKIDEVEALEAKYIRRFPDILETSKTKQECLDEYFGLSEMIAKELDQLEKEAGQSLK